MPKKNLKNKQKTIIEHIENQETQEQPSLGLGDTIAKVTKATGIDKLVKFIAGEDCGCEERKEKLNKLFRYKQPLCLTENEFNYLTEFQKVNNTTLTKQEGDEIATIWNRVFQSRKFYRPCTCNPKAWQDMINDLLIIYKEYGIN
jgi:hypothetical protein